MIILPIVTALLERSRKLYQKPAPIYEENLLNMIHETCNDIKLCRRNMSFTNDKTLTDMYIHSLIAYEMKYKHLMQLAKKQYESNCG